MTGFLTRPLEGFVQDAPREELTIAPVVESLIISSTLEILLKNQIFVDVFLMEDYEYALRKENNCFGKPY